MTHVTVDGLGLLETW